MPIVINWFPVLDPVVSGCNDRMSKTMTATFRGSNHFPYTGNQRNTKLKVFFLSLGVFDVQNFKFQKSENYIILVLTDAFSF